jgi:hypothetical protein
MHAYLCSLTSHIQSRGSVLSTLESRLPQMRWAGWCPCFGEGLEGVVVCESSDSSLSKTVTVSSVLRQDQRMQREFGSAQNGGTVCGRMHCFDKCNKHYVFLLYFQFLYRPRCVRTPEGFCTAHIREQCWTFSPISYHSFVLTSLEANHLFKPENMKAYRAERWDHE